MEGGGVVQLVARNNEDKFITGNPQITFFQTIYRRYTNFSKVERKLSFNKKVNFNTRAKCNIHKYGDLIHKLYLVFKLPQLTPVILPYNKLKTKEILLKFGINWAFENDTRNGDRESLLSDDDVTEITTLINTKITETTEIITKFTNINDIIKLFENSILDVNLFIESVLSSVIQIDENELQYKFIEAYIADIDSPVDLFNMNEIIYIYFYKVLFFDNTISVVKPDDTTYLDEIFEYIVYLKHLKLDTSVNTSSNILYNSIIESIYNKRDNLKSSMYNFITPSSISYTELDTHKIMNQVIESANLNISDITLFTNVKTVIIDNIISNITLNLSLFKNVFSSFLSRYNFILFKRFRAQTGVNPYDRTGLFNNISLIDTSAININDNFSNFFTIPVTNNVTYFYGDYIVDNINTFHKNNYEILNTDTILNFFNNDILDINVWFKLTILDNVTVDENLAGRDKLEFLYVLNLIPTVIGEQIEYAVLQYLDSLTTLLQASSDTLQLSYITVIQQIKTDLDLQMTTTNDEILTTFGDSLSMSDDDITTLINTSLMNKQTANDILTILMMRSEKLFNSMNHMDYMNNKFITDTTTVLDTHIPVTGTLPTDELALRNEIRDVIFNIINSFFTPLEDLPDYNNYFEQGRIYSYYGSGVFENSTATLDKLLDAASSIWTGIQNYFVSAYNDLFNNIILNRDYYKDNLGVEMLTLLDNFVFDVSTTLKQSYTKADDTIDYYSANSDSVFENGTIKTEFTTNVINIKTVEDNFNTYYTNYLNYNELLNLKFIQPNKNLYYFDTFDNIINFIKSIVKNNPEYGYGGDFDTDLDFILDNALDSVTIQTPIDIMNNLIAFFNLTISNSSNPFTNGTELYTWYENYNVSTIAGDQQLIDLENIKFNLINLTLDELFTDGPKISSDYNLFIQDTDVYNYLLRILAKKSIHTQEIVQIYDSFVLKKGILVTTENLYNELVNYFDNNITSLTEYLHTIDTYNSTNPNLPYSESKVIIDIQNHRTERPSTCAWVEEIGHFLIKKINICINDQIADEHTPEWLHIRNQLMNSFDKQKAHFKLIGNENLLTNQSSSKPERLLYVPMEFWFNRDVMSVLQLVALQHSDIFINLETNTLDHVLIKSEETVFKKPPILDAYMSAEYIYVESEERSKISRMKHENLFDVLQYYLNNTYDITMINDGIIEIPLRFSNPCKEIIFTIQNTIDIQNKKYTKYSYTLNGDEINPCEHISIKFNGRERQPEIYSEYFDSVIPYGYHTSIPNIGINNYVFALYPENLLPSGTANFSKLNDCFLIIKLKDSVVEDIRTNNYILNVNVFASAYNFLRIMSGMAAMSWG